MPLRPLLLALAAAAFLPGCTWRERPPNVLVVVVDGMRADAVRGSDVPSFERLAQRGLVFRTCFAHTPSTSDSAASLFSGRLPHATGVTVDGLTVDDQVPLLAETLGREGYLTLGASGVPGLRPRAATESLPGPVGPGAGVTRGFAAFSAPLEGEETPARTNERLLELLEQADGERPWLLLAHYALGAAPPEDTEDTRDTESPVDRLASRVEERRRYFESVEAVDRAIGVLLDALQQRGVYEDALVVLTGSHGVALGQHADPDQTGGLYDELLRVPLVIKLPRNHDAAAELREATTTLVRHADVTPTVLDVLGFDALPSVEGRSLTQDVQRELTAEVRPPLVDSPRYACRNERYKLIYVPAERRFEMYDLARDPLELDNVFAIEGHLWEPWQERLRELAQRDVELPERTASATPQRAQVLGR